MYLRRWLFEKDMTVTEFCKLIKNHRNHVYACMSGTKIAGKKLRNIVYEFTDGDVKIDEWPDCADDMDCFTKPRKLHSKLHIRDVTGRFKPKENKGKKS